MQRHVYNTCNVTSITHATSHLQHKPSTHVPNNMKRDLQKHEKRPVEHEKRPINMKTDVSECHI